MTINVDRSTEKSNFIFEDDPKNADEKKQLVEDLDDLFKTKKCFDITFKVGDKHLRAHKALLVARSKVFLAMFENETKEKKENVVHIIDIEADIFEQFLRYIYTGKIPALDEKNADKLFEVADKV